MARTPVELPPMFKYSWGCQGFRCGKAGKWLMGWLLLVGRGARNVLGSQICQKQIPFGNDNQEGESKYGDSDSASQNDDRFWESRGRGVVGVR